MDTDYLKDLVRTVELSLTEDVGDGDITAELIDPAVTACAEVITRERAVVAGRPWVDEVFRQVSADIAVDWRVREGEKVVPGQLLFRASGPARALLTAERPALNFLQTLSGTATRARHYVDVIRRTGARILDTRKTLPGLRRAQKYAVRCGGGENHRMGLNDAFLIKENHIIAAGSIARAVGRARQLYPQRRVEIEVENLVEFREAVDAGPDWIMLDEFTIGDLKTAVEALNRDIKLEASGGIESDADLLAIAETGVHFVSIGAITKHCKAIDLSMRFV